MLFIRRIIFRNFSSNFKPANKIRVRSDTFQNVLSTNLKDIDWHSVRKELIESERFINALNLDGIIIEKCNKDIRLDVAKSYINFLKSQSFVINDVSVSKLLRLFYRHHRKINQEYEEEKFHISEEDEAEIIKFSKSLMEKHQVLDASIAENIIHGLSLTREWTKCIDLLRHIKVTSTPSTSTYSAIILKALEEKELDITWNIINEMFSKQIVPSIIVLLKYFRMFERDDVMTEKMFEAMRDNSLLLPEKVINYYKNVFNTTRDCKIVKIGKNGNCPSCNNKLSTMKLNETEFMKLSNTFLDNVMIRRDIFIKTSPDELKRFKDFIDRAIPFDCVIDGLNVAYSHGTDQPVKMFVKNVSQNSLLAHYANSYNNSAFQIASAVKYFVDRNQTCLVIGRNHMRKWPKDKMDYIRRNSSLFLADNM